MALALVCLHELREERGVVYPPARESHSEARGGGLARGELDSVPLDGPPDLDLATFGRPEGDLDPLSLFRKHGASQEEPPARQVHDPALALSVAHDVPCGNADRCVEAPFGAAIRAHWIPVLSTQVQPSSESTRGSRQTRVSRGLLPERDLAEALERLRVNGPLELQRDFPRLTLVGHADCLPHYGHGGRRYAAC